MSSKPPLTNPLLGFLKSCFGTPFNAVVTLIILAGLALTVPGFISWTLVNAVWAGDSGEACRGINAACWVFVRLRFGQIVFGDYPPAERWRVIATVLLAVAMLLVYLRVNRRGSIMRAAGFMFVFAVAALLLLYGGIPGLPFVPTRLWGGLMLTVVVALWTISTALPLGLLLAFGRRSSIPIVAWLAGGFIDVMRCLPMIGLLFVAIVLFPLFVPPDVDIDRLTRVLIAYTLFNAAVLAEVFRGGLQTIPKGQIEAASALGLHRWPIARNIIIPQTFTASLPAIMNVSVAIVKETSLVIVVGVYEFVGTMQAGIIDPEWLVGDQVRATAYLFVAIVFWVICFSMSRISASIERKNKLKQR
ncbi:MAG TPA: amino acid ABC transporter permease [Devosiaceae bacterium]|jgi:general L-amino acid transport system permease protein